MSRYEDEDLVLKHIGFRNKVLMIRLTNQEDEKDMVKIIKGF